VQLPTLFLNHIHLLTTFNSTPFLPAHNISNSHRIFNCTPAPTTHSPFLHTISHSTPFLFFIHKFQLTQNLQLHTILSLSHTHTQHISSTVHYLQVWFVVGSSVSFKYVLFFFLNLDQSWFMFFLFQSQFVYKKMLMQKKWN
jgi:hypothetical protein